MKIAFLACGTTLPGAPNRRGDAFEHDQQMAALAAALAPGETVTDIDWRAPISDFAGFDLALIGTPWDYQDSLDLSALPRGVVHADLFRDNILFRGTDIGGVIDFYFAGVDAWLFDLAVTVNDWCMESPGELDPERLSAMLQAYSALCSVTDAEKKLWPAMLRAAALRFWLSRLYDFYLPRQGEIIKPHDPKHFHKILHGHVANRSNWPH